MSSEMQCHGCGQPVYDIDVRCGNCDIALSSTGAQRMIGSVVLDQYVVSDILGQGGMSVVYQGKHKITGQEVALKVLPPDLAAHRDLKGRFLEEGKALAQLDHPNIVHLYNFGSDGDCLVLAMQYVRGVTWERLILDEERVPWRRTAKLAAEVSGALHYAHGRGIIHRDMKPSNVLIRDLDGAATVMDFGIAKVASSDKLTATGQTMGTVRYMSPEQVRGKTVTLQTDIYSLAMTTYESLVGDTPFTGDTHFEIMTKHLNELPVPPSQLGVELPPAFERSLMRAIAKRQEDRQTSAKEFQDQLLAVLEDRSPGIVSSNIVTKSQRKRKGEDIELDQTALVGATSGVATETGDWEETGNRSGTLKLAIGAAVAVATGGTLWAITRSQGDDGYDKEEVTRASPDAQLTTPESLLKRRIVYRPQSAIDKTYPDDNLRILASEEWPADKVRSLVIQARKDYQIVAQEHGWPEPHWQPLRVVLVSQDVLCNPVLYKPGKVISNCSSESAWFRPDTLFLVPTDSTKTTQARMSFWIAMMKCVGKDADRNCIKVVQDKMDPL